MARRLRLGSTALEVTGQKRPRSRFLSTPNNMEFFSQREEFFMPKNAPSTATPVYHWDIPRHKKDVPAPSVVASVCGPKIPFDEI